MKPGLAGVGAVLRAWRWQRLSLAPHRLAFAAAALMLAACSLWWAVVNVVSSQGAALRWALPPAVGHGALMTFGFMPMFFAGFVFTAAPKWLRQPAVPARRLLAPTLAQLLGWAVFAASLHGRDPARCRLIAASGVMLVIFGWSSVSLRLLRMLRSSVVHDKVHLKLVAVAAVSGIAMLGLVAFGLVADDLALVRAATQAALWWFIGLTFMALAHRMIPFLSGAAVPAWHTSLPFWLLGCLVALCVFEGAAAFIDMRAGLHAPEWRQLHAAFELAAGTGLLVLARRSARLYRAHLRFITMLFVAFAWLGAALLLAGAARLVSPSQPAAHTLQVAAMHAYTMGFLGSTLITMVSRVSSGHSGRSVVADNFLWRLYGLLQGAVVLRLLAGPAAMVRVSAASALIVAAALVWSLACMAWAARCLAWCGLARVDGRAG